MESKATESGTQVPCEEETGHEKPIHCRQCELTFPECRHESEEHFVNGYLTLNSRRSSYGFGEYENIELYFCTPRCLITFLSDSRNHSLLHWVPKEHIRYFDWTDAGGCWECSPNPENVLPGPFLAIGGPYGSWFDDGSASTHFCSVEHLIKGLEKEEEEFKRDGLELKPWYADIR